VLHGAEIAPGNSGGPLVGYCGRVLGVNTFAIADRNLPITARYALGADGLGRFLESIGAAARMEDKSCEPQVSTAALGGAGPTGAPQAAGAAGTSPSRVVAPGGPAPAR
jgi:S1-C subfamily serine protease